MTPPIPRLNPSRPLPPYTFVPGLTPHPRTDPRGHSYGLPEPHALALDPLRWRASEDYLHGVDLWNHGYYWEAHEAWEALWHAAGRAGPVALLLKGLIKLAAAGVKVRQRMPRGVHLHGARAATHFDEVRRATGTTTLAGLDLTCLRDHAIEIAESAETLVNQASGDVTIVFSFRLEPT